MTEGFDRGRDLVRRSLADIQYATQSAENSAVNDAIRYFDRQEDHGSVRGRLKTRFTKSISRVQPGSTSDTTTGFETYVNGAKEEQINQGLIEVVTGGVGQKIATALASLFNQKTQSWQYLSNGEANEEAEAIISAQRKAGGFNTASVNCDFLACSVNSSFLLVDWVSDHLKYRVVSPTVVNTIFHDSIVDNGVERGVDYSELEDATVVVIELSTDADSNNTNQQYLAIFGRSDDYEYGRYVTYEASRWDNIPAFGQGGVDYTLPSGEPANPLSWLAEIVDYPVQEYPLIKIDGGLMRVADRLIETTTSLYENAVEIDVAFSRLLKDSLRGARGVETITNPQGLPLPRSTDGPIALQDGQVLTIDGRDSSNSVSALEVLNGLIVAVGGGYTVPDYRLIPDSQTLVAASGVALTIRTQPLIDFRDYRIQLNEQSVGRLWEIERGLITVHKEGVVDLSNVEQVWNPGKLEIPEDKTEQLNRLNSSVQNGFEDYVGAVKEYHQLPTRRAAEQLIKRIQESSREYQQPSQQQQQNRGVTQAFGLTRQ